MATPYDFAEHQCRLINAMNKLARPSKVDLELAKLASKQAKLYSSLSDKFGHFQNAFNPELSITIRNFQNNFKSLVDTQMYQPILELQAKLSTINETITNQQVAFNKIPEILNSKLSRLNSVIYKINNIDFDNCSEEAVFIDDDTLESINDFSNYIQDDITKSTETTLTSEPCELVTNTLYNNITVDYKFWINFITGLIAVIIAYSALVSSNESSKKAEEYYNHVTKVLDKMDNSLSQQNIKIVNQK